jgi:hypothetical protein
MASKTQITLVDDLDGGNAAETINFSLDGKHYEIDLSSRNASALRKAVGPYADSGRRLTSPRRGRGRPYRQVHTDIDPAAVRAWAIANDYEISARGRVSAAIIEEYRAAGEVATSACRRNSVSASRSGEMMRPAREGRDCDDSRCRGPCLRRARGWVGG